MATLSIPSCEEDCRAIHDASSDHFSSLICRTSVQRRQIRETYKAMYGEDLIDPLCRDRMTNQKIEVRTLLYLWMLEPHEMNAVLAREALRDVNYEALIEMYVTCKSSQHFLINQAYRGIFKSHLDQEIIISEPSHPYQRILIALAASHKAHHSEISRYIAKCDAQRLYEAGEGKTGAFDESVVIETFTKRSLPQMKLTFSSYKGIFGHEYTKSLKKESCGEFEDSLRVVIKCMCDPPKHFSKKLYSSMKGRKNNTRDLVRIMVTRAEMDMAEIREVFQKKYGMKLEDAIREAIPDEDYKDFLVAIATTDFAA
ncbi:hypothetical protein QJS04_geneDACA009415 [Acorus gramineus]|uniref:Uncharacterized protein n=1 Tax=Acorus gramineus TaxID=55184 RepID=A0AAV9AGT8_ACOGR|nr:hypothetical protein QJS04_geneDACA009415 [Acorus gramineus]